MRCRWLTLMAVVVSVTFTALLTRTLIAAAYSCWTDCGAQTVGSCGGGCKFQKLPSPWYQECWHTGNLPSCSIVTYHEDRYMWQCALGGERRQQWFEQTSFDCDTECEGWFTLPKSYIGEESEALCRFGTP